MPRKVLYGLLLGEPGSQRREETLGKLESIGWFAAHADWQLKSVPGRLVKLTPTRYRELSRDSDFESISQPSEDMVLLTLRIPEDKTTGTIQRGADIDISLS